MMTRRRVLLGLLVVVCLLVGVALWYAIPIMKTKRADMAPEDLLVEGPAEPGNGKWEVSTILDIPEKYGSTYGSSNYVRRVWRGRDFGRGIEVTQTVYKYGGPLRSRYYWSAIDPDYRGPYDFPLRTVAEDGYHSDSANQQVMVCETDGGSPARCFAWVYWGLFGQYLLSVRVDSLDGPMPLDDAIDIIEPIERSVAQKLGD